MNYINKILTGALIGISSIAYAQNKDTNDSNYTNNKGGPRYKKDAIEINTDTSKIHRPRYNKSNDLSLEYIAGNDSVKSSAIEMDLNSDGLIDKIVPLTNKTIYMFKQKDGTYKVEVQDHTPKKDSLNLIKPYNKKN